MTALGSTMTWSSIRFGDQNAGYGRLHPAQMSQWHELVGRTYGPGSPQTEEAI